MDDHPIRVLIVDDEPAILKTVTMALQSFGYGVTPCASPLEALEVARGGVVNPDIALLDLKMYPIDGIDLMRRLLLMIPDITPVIVTAHGTISSAVAAVKRGAFDYLQKPFELEQLSEVLSNAVAFHRQKLRLRGEHSVPGTNAGSEIITGDPGMHELIALARKAATTPLPVLIEGESGTGKELFAKLIHSAGRRSDMPFVRVNCAALPEDLLESELFGHVKGAFTGAHKDRVGRFDLADGGAIFLDEIGEVSLSVQAKLLRVIQEGEFERVGESLTRRVDVRVISATNRGLREEVRNGAFREDLYYRLAGVQLEIPPLRDRGGDVRLIALSILDRLGEGDFPSKQVSNEVMASLSLHPWPGNVRELQNVVSRAYYLSSGDLISLEDLPEEYRINGASTRAPESLEEVEREHIRRVLAESENLEVAARRLGIDPATLWRKRKKFDL